MFTLSFYLFPFLKRRWLIVNQYEHIISTTVLYVKNYSGMRNKHVIVQILCVTLLFVFQISYRNWSLQYSYMQISNHPAICHTHRQICNYLYENESAIPDD